MFTLENSNGEIVLASGQTRLRIQFVTDATARITLTKEQAFRTKPSRIVTATTTFRGFSLHETPGALVVATPRLRLLIDRATGAIQYGDARGNPLVREPERGGKRLKSKKVFRHVYRKDVRIASDQSIDGARVTVEEGESVFDRMAFEARLDFVFADDEAIFGLGSHEEGFGNLRGKRRELYQHNLKAVVPYFVSTRGYGVLLDCGSLMTFEDGPGDACWWADVVDELDYYFIRGETFDDVTRGYHELTGKVPMLPKWAFGYVQSKERYIHAREILDVVREYRRRQIPLDLIVLDWKSWPNGAGWGQKSFDPARFPDPGAFIRELHSLNARLMVSIWPIMTGGCSNQRELRQHGLMLGNQSTYDAYLDTARACYWEQASHGLFAHEVDAWWCDCTEPFEADWQGEVEPESTARLRINVEAAKKYLDAGELNTYSLLHSQGIYEGQRRETSAKRVLNLTRSSYAGQHRYATVTWNGDICATWETLRRCIPEGVNFCVTGEPYWTVDIGGFFIANNPKLWFWRGDYNEGCRGLTDMNALEPDPKDTGCRDLGFHELYVRWLQYAVFLPMFRSHGTDAAREIWRFGEPGNPFYDTIAQYLRLRYQLMPYIYSMAAQVTLHSRSMLRAVALEYPHDLPTHHLTDQFMFGPALLVCPVTEPMYYGRNSQPMHGVSKVREVYLPAGNRWYDFWTEAVHDGGQTIAAAAPLGTIPVFIRAGAVLPMTQAMQYVDEIPDAPCEIRVYRGADGSFALYDDAGDGYDYEQGAYAVVTVAWDEAGGELTLAAREGGFPGLVQEREFRIVAVSATGREKKIVRYKGAALRVSFTDQQSQAYGVW